MKLGEKPLLSVVLDSNVWISAVVHGGNSEVVLRFCLTNVEIVASEILAQEIFDYFQYQTKAPQRWRRFFRIIFEKICTIVTTDNSKIEQVRDPKDNHIIMAALRGDCSLIVTGDRDLLDLKNYQGIKIISPANFLELHQVKKYSRS